MIVITKIVAVNHKNQTFINLQSTSIEQISLSGNVMGLIFDVMVDEYHYKRNCPSVEDMINNLM